MCVRGRGRERAMNCVCESEREKYSEKTYNERE